MNPGPVPRELARYQRERRTSHVAALVHRLPAGASANLDAEAYLAKLDEVLEDRLVSADEAAALEELALELGIGSGDLPRIHFAYLRDLARFAIADHFVTPEERADLETVARLLGFPATAAEAALEAAKNAASAPGIAERRPLEKGMLVCFSETERDRETLEAAAVMAGLITRTNVSKKTDVVVTADPLSKSAKLEKARALGKRILLESVYVAMVNEMHGGDRGEHMPNDGVAPAAAPASLVASRPSSPAGWYADPWGQPCFRYWDGRGWTRHMTARTA